MRRRTSFSVCGHYASAQTEQSLHTLYVALGSRVEQGSTTVLIRHVNSSPAEGDQLIDAVYMTSSSRAMQGC